MYLLIYCFRLQDLVNTLKRKTDEKRQSTEDEVKKLTKEVERYHANVEETENKALKISEMNEKKFQSIWEMKDDEAKELLNKVNLKFDLQRKKI